MIELNSYAQTQFKEVEGGLIPVDWNCVPIGQLVDQNEMLIFNGFSCSNRNQEGVGLPHLRPMNISDDGLVTLEGLNYVEVDRHMTRYFMQVGDVLFNNTNSEELVGKAAYWNLNGDFGLSNHMTVIRVLSEEKLHPLFLAKFLYKLWLDGYARSICRRYVNQAGISLERIRNIPLVLPPFSEQRRIAVVLSAIQDEISAQEDIITSAKDFKRSLMQRLFTYGVRVQLAETKETPFGDIPSHWEVMLLDECAFVQTVTAKGRKFDNDEEIITVPYLRVANVQDGFLDLSEIKSIEIRAKELERYSLQVGDVLMTEGGDFDKLGRGFVWKGEIENCIHQNHVFAVRVNRELLSPEFLAYLGQSPYGKAYFLTVAHRTTNLASINTTKLKGLPVPIATCEEQAEIVEMLQAADAKIAAEEDRKTAIQDFFKTMLHQLMTGQLRLLSDEGLPL